MWDILPACRGLTHIALVESAAHDSAVFSLIPLISSIAHFQMSELLICGY